MKKRLDILVFERGFAESREKAKALIMAGEVFVDNQKADKAGQSYDENANIEFRGKAPKYVSRGGLKLEKAINNFNIDLKDKITMDIGASTGGFRLYASERRKEGLFHRRRLRSARVEAQNRRARREPRENQYAKRNRGARPR